MKKKLASKQPKTKFPIMLGNLGYTQALYSCIKRGGDGLSVSPGQVKSCLLSKFNEQLELIQNIDKLDYCEITIKHVKGEVITHTSFSDKDKMK